MKRTKSYFIATAIVAVLVGLLALSGGHTSQAAPGAQDVNVVNPTDRPVPTRAQGTTAVAGTVQAQQGGSWNVAITGTPTFQVGNTADNPVWIRDSVPTREPFSQVLSNTFAQQGSGLIGFQVPDGKRLVIEFISGLAEVPAGEKCVVRIQAIANSIPYNHYLTATYQATFANSDDFVISQPITMSADPSTTVNLQWTRSGNGTAAFIFNVSGYLIDVQ